ncbi:uncharacterized protein LOC142579805 isoform X2 [Dermacentor variabilis]|uniref:uncharacterized protein LOC142579805 isoform X2 n=1 Tax=Dermacentor variabilis TaxID=34621 RepID=UPI003F5BE5B4
MDSSVRDQLESEVIYDRHVATYKWLASKFDLHTNTAKRYLKEFTNEQEADGNNVTGHCIITGKQDKLYRIILTASQSVPETRKDLTTVTGVHAFSAQPSNLEDCIDRLTEAVTSTIKLSVCPIYCEAAQRTRGTGKRLNGVSTAAERKAVSPAKPPPCKQESKPPAPPKSEPVKAEKDKPTPTSKASAKTKPKQNDLAAAFSKTRTGAASTSAKSTPLPEKKDVDDNKKAPKAASSGGEATKRKSVDKSPSEKATPEKKRVKTEPPTSPEVSSATRKKPSRRHVISDSEDEDDETTQSTTPASSEILKSSATSSVATSEGDKFSVKSSPDSGTQGGQKKRRRVMKSVKKTFKDEEGFLVTKLVKELVSESDDDEDPLPKALREKTAPEKPAGKKKAVASGDKKQQSLLSFFGKK